MGEIAHAWQNILGRIQNVRDSKTCNKIDPICALNRLLHNKCLFKNDIEYAIVSPHVACSVSSLLANVCLNLMRQVDFRVIEIGGLCNVQGPNILDQTLLLWTKARSLPQKRNASSSNQTTTPRTTICIVRLGPTPLSCVGWKVRLLRRRWGVQ